jgi:hypothetical protein
MAVRRLNTIMRGLGHEWLDMLKVDVEGAEWAAFEDLLAEEKHQLLPFTQLQARRPGCRTCSASAPGGSHPPRARRPVWRRRRTGCGLPRHPWCARAGLSLGPCDCSGGCVARAACCALPITQHSRLASAPSATLCTTLFMLAPFDEKLFL